MTIRAVVFDWGGVLTTPPLLAVRAIEAELGYSHRQMLDWMFHSGTASATDGPGSTPAEEDFALLEMGSISFEEFSERVLARSAEHLGAAMPRETYDRICGLFLTDAGVAAVNWPLVHLARRLRERGIATAILTNQIPQWREFWRSSVPLEDFDVVVDSCDVGLRKPDPAVFRLTCDLLGVAPGEVVLLDDSPRNTVAAEAFGMRSILVKDPLAAVAAIEDLVDCRSNYTCPV